MSPSQVPRRSLLIVYAGHRRGDHQYNHPPPGPHSGEIRPGGLSRCGLPQAAAPGAACEPAPGAANTPLVQHRSRPRSQRRSRCSIRPKLSALTAACPGRTLPGTGQVARSRTPEVYHQQTKNLLVSYLAEEVGLLLGAEKGRLTWADAHQAPLSAVSRNMALVPISHTGVPPLTSCSGAFPGQDRAKSSWALAAPAGGITQVTAMLCAIPPAGSVLSAWAVGAVGCSGWRGWGHCRP